MIAFKSGRNSGSTNHLMDITNISEVVNTAPTALSPFTS